ncbi:MAG: hypothetical protein AB4290_24200 [Spirulina sp.]
MRHNKELIKKISIEKLSAYLKEKGWNKRKEKKDFGALWEWQEHKMFLPLNPEFSDYYDKLLEVCILLEKVENRSYLEIVKPLQRASVLANELQREVIEIKISDIDDNKNEVNAEKIGGVFRTLQGFVDSFNPQKIDKNLELSVLGTFQGSFGIQLALGQRENVKQLNLFGEDRELGDISKAIEIIGILLELIRKAQQDDKQKEELKKILIELDKKSVIRFIDLFEKLSSLDANIYLDWGSINSDFGGEARISYKKLIESLAWMKQEDLAEPEILRIRGKLDLGGVGDKENTRKFIITEIDSQEEYRGIIQPELLTQLNNNLSVGKYHRATLKKSMRINRRTEQEKIDYTLIDLSELEDIEDS